MVSMKIKNIGLLAPLFFCFGCGQEERSTICRLTEQNNEILLYSKGDQVITQTETAFFTYDALGISAESEKMEEMLDGLFQALKASQHGTEVEIVKKEDGLQITIILDCTKAEFDQLYEAGLIDQPADQISLKKTLDGLEKQGYQCSLRTKEE